MPLFACGGLIGYLTGKRECIVGAVPFVTGLYGTYPFAGLSKTLLNLITTVLRGITDDRISWGMANTE